VLAYARRDGFPIQRFRQQRVDEGSDLAQASCREAARAGRRLRAWRPAASTFTGADLPAFVVSATCNAATLTKASAW
jgi:hypothetical protein